MDSIQATPHDIAVNQASNLPTDINITLQPVRKLQDRNKLRVWQYHVRNTLKGYGLADLIDTVLHSLGLLLMNSYMSSGRESLCAWDNGLQHK
jgi:hypothetical protein